jgi:hypothetical protein
LTKYGKSATPGLLVSLGAIYLDRGHSFPSGSSHHRTLCQLRIHTDMSDA